MPKPVQEMANDEIENIESVKEELEEKLEEIEDEIEEAETPEKLNDIDKRIEGLKSWVTETLVGPITALTAEMSKANELKAQALQKAMNGTTPAQAPQDQTETELQTGNPSEIAKEMEEVTEVMEEKIEEMEQEVKKAQRKIVPL